MLCEYMPYRACEKIIKCLMSVSLSIVARSCSTWHRTGWVQFMVRGFRAGGRQCQAQPGCPEDQALRQRVLR